MDADKRRYMKPLGIPFFLICVHPRSSAVKFLPDPFSKLQI